MPKNRIHTRSDGRKSYKYTDATGKRCNLLQRKTESVTAFRKRCDKADKMAGYAYFDFEITFDDLHTRWVKDYQKIYCGPSDFRVSQPAYESFIRPIFGHLKLNQIKRAACHSFLLSCAKKGYSSSYLTRIRQCISRPWNWAADTLHLEIPCPVTGLKISVFTELTCLSVAELYRL